MEYTYIHTGIHTVEKEMNHFLDIREQSGMGYQILFRVESNLKVEGPLLNPF